MKLRIIAVARTALQQEISSLSSNQSASSTEVETFRHKVEDTEREKRDLMGVVSRLKEDIAQRDGTSLVVHLTYGCLMERSCRGDPNPSCQPQAGSSRSPDTGKSAAGSAFN